MRVCTLLFVALAVAGATASDSDSYRVTFDIVLKPKVREGERHRETQSDGGERIVLASLPPLPHKRGTHRGRGEAGRLPGRRGWMSSGRGGSTLGVCAWRGSFSTPR